MTTLYKVDGTPIEISGSENYSIGVDATDEKLYLYVDGVRTGEGIEINPENEVV